MRNVNAKHMKRKNSEQSGGDCLRETAALIRDEWGVQFGTKAPRKIS